MLHNQNCLIDRFPHHEGCLEIILDDLGSARRRNRFIRVRCRIIRVFLTGVIYLLGKISSFFRGYIICINVLIKLLIHIKGIIFLENT